MNWPKFSGLAGSQRRVNCQVASLLGIPVRLLMILQKFGMKGDEK